MENDNPLNQLARVMRSAAHKDAFQMRKCLSVAALQLETLAEWRGALLWALYRHQGGHSDIGQPIRELLGIGQFDHLTDEQIAEAKAFAAHHAKQGAA